MSILKMDRINAALSKLRISGITVEPSPEYTELALNELEAMMAELDSDGLTIGYNFELEPDPNSDLGVPIQYWNMINTNLAVRLIPDFNKQVPQTLMAQASQSLSKAYGRLAVQKLNGVAYPSRMAIGSGNRYLANRRYQNFFARSEIVPPNTNVINNGETFDYRENFRAFIGQDNVIDSYTITASDKLTVISSSIDDESIKYRLNANGEAGNLQTVAITVTTDDGRVDSRKINFDLRPR